MSCQVVIEFRAKEECVEKLLPWLRQILPDTRCREGCVLIAVTRNQDDPTNFIFVEQWDSRQHYERYFAWRQETGVLDQLAGMIRGPASFRFFDYVGL